MNLKKHKFISFFGSFTWYSVSLGLLYTSCPLAFFTVCHCCIAVQFVMGYNLVLKMTQCELWTRGASVTSPSIYKIHKASGQTAENDHFRFNQTAGKVLAHWVGRSPSAIGPYLWLQWTFSSLWIWAHGLQQMNTSGQTNWTLGFDVQEFHFA